MREIFGHSSEVLVWLGEPLNMASSRQYNWIGCDMDLILTSRDKVLRYGEGALNKPEYPDLNLDLTWNSGVYGAKRHNGPGYTYEVFCLLTCLSRSISPSQIWVFGSGVDERYKYHKHDWVKNIAASIRYMVDRAWVRQTTRVHCLLC
jgi:hypothetical protein